MATEFAKHDSKDIERHSNIAKYKELFENFFDNLIKSKRNEDRSG